MKQKAPLDPPGWQRIPGDRVLHRYCRGQVIIRDNGAACLKCGARWRQRYAKACWQAEKEEVA